ncbi:MAG: phosphomannomutase, partial [Halobacteriaceae archaeon]
WIDGIASAAMLTMLVAQHSSISALTKDITQRPYRKASLDCPERYKQPVMNQLEKRLKREFPAAELSTDHGIRLSFSDGSWILVRQSGTEPKLRLYCESDRIDDLFEKAKSIVSDTVADNRK